MMAAQELLLDGPLTTGAWGRYVVIISPERLGLKGETDVQKYQNEPGNVENISILMYFDIFLWAIGTEII